MYSMESMPCAAGSTPTKTQGQAHVNQASIESLLPEHTYELIIDWLAPYACSIKLAPPRSTKFGDFRPASRQRPAAISINKDLPPLQMLLTLTHEIAHLIAWETHGGRIRPHGTEWKACFSELLDRVAAIESLPFPFRNAVSEHARRPRSTAFLDPKLHDVLRQLERPHERSLSSLSIGQEFEFRGRSYRKLSSHRTRCTCLDIRRNQKVRISMMAPIDS